jgi:Meiotically up-regulated gene 113
MTSADIASPEVSGNTDYPPTYVYVISAGEAAVKVGLATRPAERLSALQTAHYQHLTLFYSIACTAHEAVEVERRAHQILKDKRLSGEWFSVTPEEAKSAVDRAKELILASGVSAKVRKLPEIRAREISNDRAPLKLTGDRSPAILTTHDMELAKGFFERAVDEGAIADDYPVLVCDPGGYRDALMFWWTTWDWEDALTRLSFVRMNFRKFNRSRWTKRNEGYLKGAIFSFHTLVDEKDRAEKPYFHLLQDATVAVRENGVDALLIAMMEQGAPSPCAGLICENGRPGTRYAAA